MIEIKGLHKYFGENQVLKGIDQSVDEGEVLCIIGPSGSGKSTMLRCINRLEEPTDGEIYMDGELITEENLDRIRTKMGMVFQQFNLFPHMSVLDNLTCGPVNVKGVDKAAAEEKAKSLLARVGLAEKAAEFPRNLSGGQQQRVAIARALAMDPEVMLFLIIELVGSTGYSSIMYNDPVSLNDLKPHLEKTVRNIIETHTVKH